MPELPSASGGAQTSALNPVMNEIGTLLDVPAGEGASPSASLSPPIPMQYVGPGSQEFQQMEAEWYQRYTDHAEKVEAKHYLRFQKCQSECLQRCEKKNRELQEKSAEIASLIVESSPQVFLLYLTGIQVTLLYEKTERMKLERRFNLRGAFGNNHKVYLFSCY